MQATDKYTHPHGHALRKGRCSIPGQIYSITTVTRERIPYFADFYTARRLIKILQEHEYHGDAKTLCFIVMPDHLHWLMELGNRKDLSGTIQSVKSITSKQCGQKLWQRGFHERAIRKEEDLQAIARYIVANPLRAGLVKTVREYPHWDAVWL